MFYKNARIFTENFTFQIGAFEVTEDGKFGAVLCDAIPEDAIDLHGATVIPGLIDIHNHGNSGVDFSDGSYEGVEKMARYLAKSGITSFAPTSMTLPYEVLAKAFATARQLADNRPADCARLMGIQMEGPYFSTKKKGAQNEAYLKNPDYEGFLKLYEDCGGLIRVVGLAPELPGSIEFVEKASKLCTVAIAHTDADYDTARDAIASGATLLTHLFNGMPGIGHRAPGVIPAAAENKNVSAELICDGLHVHPASVRLAFSIFGGDRVVLISDALNCCGMPDGQYEIGRQIAFLSGGIARLTNGTIAGSASNLYTGMRNAISFGIAEEDAVRAASYNPARAINALESVGSIAPGKLADFLVCSPDYAEKRVFLGGKELV